MSGGGMTCADMVVEEIESILVDYEMLQEELGLKQQRINDLEQDKHLESCLEKQNGLLSANCDLVQVNMKMHGELGSLRKNEEAQKKLLEKHEEKFKTLELDLRRHQAEWDREKNALMLRLSEQETTIADLRKLLSNSDAVCTELQNEVQKVKRESRDELIQMKMRLESSSSLGEGASSSNHLADMRILKNKYMELRASTSYRIKQLEEELRLSRHFRSVVPPP